VTAYARPPGAKHSDFAGARAFEEEVANAIQKYTGHAFTRFSSADDLDILVPQVWVEVKQKRGPLTSRWHLLTGVAESDCFVIDERTLRVAAHKGGHVYFLIEDVPGRRLVVAAAYEFMCVERKRVVRDGKAKLIVDLSAFRTIESLDDLYPFCIADAVSQTWKISGPVTKALVEEVKA